MICRSPSIPARPGARAGAGRTPARKVEKSGRFPRVEGTSIAYDDLNSESVSSATDENLFGDDNMVKHIF
jgi:hypothetical protein